MSLLQYVVKIKGADDSTDLAQIINPNDLNIEKVLNDFSTATFFLPYTSQFANPTILKQFNRVDIYEQIETTEYRVFEGVIRGYEADLEGVTVECEDFLYLLSRRILFSNDYTATAEAVNTTLSNLFTTMNGVDDTGLTINTDDILTTVVNKEYSRGDDHAKMIKDLALATEAEFIIRDRKLEFKSTIGIDRTVAGTGDYRDFRFDIDNPNENSILRADIVNDSINFSNAVLGKADSNYNGQTDSPSITEYGRIETLENFPDSGSSGLADQTTEFLNLHKFPQLYPRIVPATNDLFFKDIEVGDLVTIFINTGSDLFSFDDDYKIVKKTLRRIENAQPQIALEFSENALSDKNFLNEFAKLQNEVKTLILKS